MQLRRFREVPKFRVRIPEPHACGDDVRVVLGVAALREVEAPEAQLVGLGEVTEFQVPGLQKRIPRKVRVQSYAVRMCGDFAKSVGFLLILLNFRKIWNHLLKLR